MKESKETNEKAKDRERYIDDKRTRAARTASEEGRQRRRRESTREGKYLSEPKVLFQQASEGSDPMTTIT
jgi:hypothetical protein